MDARPAKASKEATSHRQRWAAVFGVGALVLIGSVLAIVAHPVAGSVPRWIFWLALGSGLLCVLAAIQLRNWSRYDAADDAVWLAKIGSRGSSDAPDGWDGGDD
ncbi:hypothetical protein K4L06_04085 [Lysobacter sp. BMK333-48F3]|uniref:hypothetical protein n=1 Tax=Lysobacter sp. BMK333-48F3 TaxID=2867962 RepID=UPI001C8C000B|nr:hypothetical protein [Lysobacter sp. BMK333-48F3]MBX9400479.1 hypothetical protein [Lysobacter sp. BMK333-48F3]